MGDSVALRKYRPTVTVADGRVFRGIHPQELSESNGETPYIRALAAQVAGVPEVTLPAGRADVLNETTAFEVEPARAWRAGVRQAYGYAAMTGCSPAVALFGTAHYVKIYKEVRDKMPGVQLWIWNGSRFDRCGSMRVAQRHTRATARTRTEALAAERGRRSAAARQRSERWVAEQEHMPPAPLPVRGRAIDDPVKLTAAALMMRTALKRRSR